jgi:hypothetical protein
MNVEKNVDKVVTVLVSTIVEDGSSRLTLYEVTGVPRGFDAGHLASITDWNDAVTEAGGSGVAVGMNVLDIAAGEGPTLFTAITDIVYVTP